MATLAQYNNALKQSSAAVARKMGVHFAGADMQTRVMVRVILGMFATLIKLLVDKGVLTDAEIQTAFDAAAGTAYTPEPSVPDEPVPATVPPATVAGTATIPETTL
jgi:hypothetical protein